MVYGTILSKVEGYQELKEQGHSGKNLIEERHDVYSVGGPCLGWEWDADMADTSVVGVVR